MSTILDEIVANRRAEVLGQKKLISREEILAKTDLNVSRNSLVNSLTIRGSSGIIAEFKRESPSKGIINEMAQPYEVTKGYAKAGASGLSVLTEGRYFGGNTNDFSGPLWQPQSTLAGRTDHRRPDPGAKAGDQPGGSRRCGRAAAGRCRHERG